MAAKNTRNNLIWMKLGTRETPRSKMKTGGSNMVRTQVRSKKKEKSINKIKK